MRSSSAPKAGDFRVQPHLGGTEVACAAARWRARGCEAALAAAPAAATYARVDMIAGDDGTLGVIELELIEPALFLEHAPDDGAAFAAAIAAPARANSHWRIAEVRLGGDCASSRAASISATRALTGAALLRRDFQRVPEIGSRLIEVGCPAISTERLTGGA